MINTEINIEKIFNMIHHYFFSSVIFSILFTSIFTQQVSTTVKGGVNGSTTTENPYALLNRVYNTSDNHVIFPNLTNHNATIIFLHNWGGSGYPFAKEMKEVVPRYVKLVCPTARVRNLTYQGIMKTAWFDRGAADPGENEDPVGVDRACTYVHNLIVHEMKRGIQSKRIIVGGFGQGAALALRSVLMFPIRLGGIISLSGWLPLRNDFHESYVTANDHAPIFQAHGEYDKLVPFPLANKTSQLLKMVSNNVTFKVYKELVHTISSEEKEDVKAFINKLLGNQ